TLLLFGTLDAVDVFEQRIQRSKLIQQSRRADASNQGHTWYVIDLVAGEGQVVHNLVRTYPPILGQGFDIHDFLVPQIEQAYVIADQLASILISRHDQHVEPALAGAAGQGGDHVVGFHLGFNQNGDPETLEDAPNDRYLGDQVGRHLRPIRLV